MLIAFSESFGTPRAPYDLGDTVRALVERKSRQLYAGNVYAAITWSRGRRVRFTLETRGARATGSRRAASGRHMRKASWEAHRDVLRALFELDPAAVVRTAYATYDGRESFEREHAATAHANCGSIMNPVTIRSTTV